MSNKPARHQQSDGEEDRDNRQPVPPSPPEGQQKAHPQDNAGQLARDDVEAAEDQQRADQGRPEITRGEREGADSALHVGDASLAGIQRDGLDTAACAAGRYGVSEFVKRNDQHLFVVVISFLSFFLLSLFFFLGLYVQDRQYLL